MNTSDGMSSGQNHFGDTSQPDDTNPRERLENNPERSLFEREITRRGFVTTAAALTGGVCFGTAFPLQSAGTIAAKPESEASTGTVPLRLRVNGQSHSLSVDPRVTLLDLLRENLALTGSKKGCDHGQCGACTVLANGRRINSCLSLAVVHEGDEITTVEGLAKGNNLHPIQAAFLEHDGFQCGYCTPGQICSAVALFEEHKRGDASFVTTQLSSPNSPDLTPDEIQERMSGNICRCGAYPGIVSAIQSVAHDQRNGGSEE
jgi:xanthine dehydrogenase YagT iron-sulfur-binding subunit